MITEPGAQGAFGAVPNRASPKFRTAVAVLYRGERFAGLLPQAVGSPRAPHLGTSISGADSPT